MQVPSIVYALYLTGVVAAPARVLNSHDKRQTNRPTTGTTSRTRSDSLGNHPPFSTAGAASRSAKSAGEKRQVTIVIPTLSLPTDLPTLLPLPEETAEEKRQISTPTELPTDLPTDLPTSDLPTTLLPISTPLSPAFTTGSLTPSGFFTSTLGSMEQVKRQANTTAVPSEIPATTVPELSTPVSVVLTTDTMLTTPALTTAALPTTLVPEISTPLATPVSEMLTSTLVPTLDPVSTPGDVATGSGPLSSTPPLATSVI